MGGNLGESTCDFSHPKCQAVFKTLLLVPNLKPSDREHLVESRPRRRNLMIPSPHTGGSHGGTCFLDELSRATLVTGCLPATLELPAAVAEEIKREDLFFGLVSSVEGKQSQPLRNYYLGFAAPTSLLKIQLPLILGSGRVLQGCGGTLALGNTSGFPLPGLSFKFFSTNCYAFRYDHLSTESKGPSTLILQVYQFLHYLFTISFPKPFVSIFCLPPPSPTSVFPPDNTTQQGCLS